jgi:formate dehydrogenase iron-sulfur subunit
VLQHVTTACHHCVEPACLHGCPVKAYEKDPHTGIVRHLDDQCIGCQYCILKCPYEVPVYSPKKGIVRKCDMCHQRLSVGEAPACVQSCPNQAIRIKLVDIASVREDSEIHAFLPGAPDPTITLPTTSYLTNKTLPRNTRPADYFHIHTSHAHMPLVWMMILTQLSVGGFAIEQFVQLFLGTPQLKTAETTQNLPPLQLVHVIVSFALGLLGLMASTLHLGRPFYAFRAILGIRTSWLSREILCFGLFAGAAGAYVSANIAVWFGYGSMIGSSRAEFFVRCLGAFALFSGLIAIWTSVMIYVDTRRSMWGLGSTAVKFFQTALILGISLSFLVASCVTMIQRQADVIEPSWLAGQIGRDMLLAMMLLVLLKLGTDVCFLLHLKDPQLTMRRRSADLLVGQLKRVFTRRLILGVLGGLILPLFVLSSSMLQSNVSDPKFAVAVFGMSFLLLTLSELHERYLFFTACVTPRMPGSPS